MKEILAIIRMNKINATKEALVEAGFPAFTACKVAGRGKRPLDQQMVEAMVQDPEVSTEVLPLLALGPRLLPKRMISLVVPDELVGKVVDKLIQVNRTGNPGDGKIFVLPISDVARVRTGQTGEAAVDEMTG